MQEFISERMTQNVYNDRDVMHPENTPAISTPIALIK